MIAHDWLYIDSGEVSLTQGKYSPGTFQSKQFRMSLWIIILTVNGTENATFGIDLSKDWTNASLTFIRTERPRISDTVSAPALLFDNGANWIYRFGGHIGPATSPSASVEFYNTGLLRFNFKTLTLTNSSELGSPLLGGALLNVPIYGPNGILIVLGGLDNDQRVGFNNISVFDKNEQKWYSQVAEGDIPQPRSLFCAVGVQGKAHATFEM